VGKEGIEIILKKPTITLSSLTSPIPTLVMPLTKEQAAVKQDIVAPTLKLSAAALILLLVMNLVQVGIPMNQFGKTLKMQ
jgi:hypothetical protein